MRKFQFLSAHSLYFCFRFCYLVFLNSIQMTRYGIDFDYKVAYRNAWLYCTAIISTFTVLSITLFVTSIDDFLGGDFLYDVFLYFSSSYHQNQFLTAPLLTYIYIMRNLQKRYAVLNQLLRFVLHFSNSYCYFEFYYLFTIHTQKRYFRWKWCESVDFNRDD